MACVRPEACDKAEVNKKLNREIEELFNPWVIRVYRKLKDTDAIPAPEMSQFGQWMEQAGLPSGMMNCDQPCLKLFSQWE